MTIDRNTLLFFDASCLVAAAGSPRGGSGFLLSLCSVGFPRGAASELVMVEAERNTSAHFCPEAWDRLMPLAGRGTLSLVPVPSSAQLEASRGGVTEKDAHVVASLRASSAPFLVTLDRPLLTQVNALGLTATALAPGEFITQQLPLHADYPTLGRWAAHSGLQPLEPTSCIVIVNQSMITGLHHVALAVRDMDETAAFYSATFGLPGLEVTETLPDQGVRAGFIPLGNARIELLQPLRPDSTVGRFLDRHGEGLHHLCLETDDVTAELARIAAQGVTLIDQAPRHGLGGLIGFLHPKSTGSVLIELVQVNGDGGAIAVEQDGRVLRVLIAKPGLDGHDRGAKVVARALRDAGMEVIYTGIRQTPDMIAEAALQEDVDAVGLSILSGAHMELCPRVIQLLRAKGMGDLPVFIGGIIPQEDIEPLKAAGIQAVFGPGTTTSTIIDFVRALPVEDRS